MSYTRDKIQEQIRTLEIYYDVRITCVLLSVYALIIHVGSTLWYTIDIYFEPAGVSLFQFN